MDINNALQSLNFVNAKFDKFGAQDGAFVDHLPFELRSPLQQWALTQTFPEIYFFEDSGRAVVTRDGWEAFVLWVCKTLDKDLTSDDR